MNINVLEYAIFTHALGTIAFVCERHTDDRACVAHTTTTRASEADTSRVCLALVRACLACARAAGGGGGLRWARCRYILLYSSIYFS